MISCELVEINKIKHSIPLSFRMHHHEKDELVYFVSGSGETKIGGKRYKYSAGDFAYYKRGTQHDEVNLLPCEIFWVHFDCSIKGFALEEGVFRDSDMRLLKCLQSIWGLSFQKDFASELLIEAALVKALVLAKQRQVSSEEKEKINWQELAAYIEQNFSEEISFSQIAKKYNYSLDRFRHLFSEHFGASPTAYLIVKRVGFAKYLLENSNLNITDIAFECGFGSSSQFTNVFKKHIGLSPKEYRKKSKEKNPR